MHKQTLLFIDDAEYEKLVVNMEPFRLRTRHRFEREYRSLIAECLHHRQ